MVALTVGVPAVMSKDAIFAAGGFTEVEAFADLFTAGHAWCSVTGEGIVFDQWAQASCDWCSLTKGQATVYVATRHAGLSQGSHINIFVLGSPTALCDPGQLPCERGDRTQ